MRQVSAALLIALGAAFPVVPQVAINPPSTNDPIIRPGLPDTWIPERRKPEDVTALVPDPRLQAPRPNVQSIITGAPAPVGAVCAPKDARQSPEHEAAFEEGLRQIYDGDIPAAIAALQASLDVAVNRTELTLSWQVLGDLYEDQGMTDLAANARQAVADLGCTKP